MTGSQFQLLMQMGIRPKTGPEIRSRAARARLGHYGNDIGASCCVGRRSLIASGVRKGRLSKSFSRHLAFKIDKSCAKE